MNNHSAIASSAMQREVLQGLCGPQKSLPSKYFYDERGSRLFEQITRLDEYYPTRIEITILKENIEEIARQIGSEAILVELGSGSSKKTRILLDRLPGLAAYVPVEISEHYLVDITQTLKNEYPDLIIKPVCADYTRPFRVPDVHNPHARHVLFYPGSTIGNFHPERARDFLKSISTILNAGGGMLIGVDLKKDKSTLEAAYNDRQGVTAAFNKNILLHLNSALDADFDLDLFRHNAFYNETEGRIEMHLVSETSQVVTVAGDSFRFDKGETIHTENSYKYRPDEFEKLVHPWFSVKKIWKDKNGYFSLQYLTKTKPSSN